MGNSRDTSIPKSRLESEGLLSLKKSYLLYNLSPNYSSFCVITLVLLTEHVKLDTANGEVMFVCQPDCELMQKKRKHHHFTLRDKFHNENVLLA